MKKIKMLLYGEPGAGKSVFACKSPNPFFITTDGNYEWLEDFGAKPEAHIQVSSWNEAKQAFKMSFDGYDTIVVDLLEDLFKWCEREFCIKSRIEHVSDIDYGKGYDITRNEFYLELFKLLAKDKHVILITHGITFTVKDRRGVEHTKYAPSSRLPDKVLDMIEGRVRYCLRCYTKAEEKDNGTLVKNRYLSLVPKENEFGIIRGVDENTLPQDIPLEWSEFVKYIGFSTEKEETKTDSVLKNQTIVPKEIKKNTSTESESTVIKEVEIEKSIDESKEIKDETEPDVVITTKKREFSENSEENIEKNTNTSTSKSLTNEEKLAAIKAKMKLIKENNN